MFWKARLIKTLVIHYAARSIRVLVYMRVYVRVKCRRKEHKMSLRRNPSKDTRDRVSAEAFGSVNSTSRGHLEILTLGSMIAIDHDVMKSFLYVKVVVDNFLKTFFGPVREEKRPSTVGQFRDTLLLRFNCALTDISYVTFNPIQIDDISPKIDQWMTKMDEEYPSVYMLFFKDFNQLQFKFDIGGRKRNAEGHSAQLELVQHIMLYKQDNKFIGCFMSPMFKSF